MLVKKENIFLNLEGANRNEIIEKMITKANIMSKNEMKNFKNLLKNVDTDTTSVGRGVEITHAKANNLDNIEVLVGTSRQETINNNDSKLFFLVLSNRENYKGYLNTLSEISRKCRQNNDIAEVIEKGNLNEIHNFLTNK